MIEQDVYSVLSTVAPTYCGSLPQKVSEGICYQVASQSEDQHQTGFSRLTKTRFRVSIISDYRKAKQWLKAVKLALRCSLKMQWINSWDIFGSPFDASDNTFSHVACDFYVTSNEVEDDDTAFSTAFSEAFA